MAIEIQVFNSANNISRNFSVDFDCQLLAASGVGVSSEQKYFFKIVNPNQDENGRGYNVVILQDLSDLALNGQKQAATNTATAYTNIKAMIEDHIYDQINGHAAGKFGTDVTEKAPMKFSNT